MCYWRLSCVWMCIAHLFLFQTTFCIELWFFMHVISVLWRFLYIGSCWCSMCHLQPVVVEQSDEERRHFCAGLASQRGVSDELASHVSLTEVCQCGTSWLQVSVSSSCWSCSTSWFFYMALVHLVLCADICMCLRVLLLFTLKLGTILWLWVTLKVCRWYSPVLLLLFMLVPLLDAWVITLLVLLLIESLEHLFVRDKWWRRGAQ